MSCRRLLPGLLCLLAACGSEADRRGATVMYASGADLQSINPLFTVHPLARQVQRYVLLTTLVRYDSLMRVEPALARRWEWSVDRTRLTLHLFPRLRWHDGAPTTARDAAWTLERGRDPATGYPRQNDLAGLTEIRAADDSTLVLGWRTAPGRIPDVLTDLAILPAHLLDGIEPARLRQAGWNTTPVGNGPFRFVAHEANRRWVFARNPDFPAELGGPPALDRLVIAVVDEPMTKLAALTSGELDFAALQPAYAEFARQDPAIVVRDYPVLFTNGIVFNARRAPFNDLAARRRVSAALDRAALVAGFAYGFATPAEGPVPPELMSVAGENVPGSGFRVPSVAEARRSGNPEPGTRNPELRFELLTVGSGEAALEQMIQAQLAKAGIAATIRQLELSAFLDRVYGAHDFDAAVLGTPGDLGLGYLEPLARLSGLPLADHPRIPDLLAFYQDAVPVAFLYHARGVQGVNRRLLGVQLGLRGELASVSQWRLRP
ncbi:MAG TPA: ABC transporter substrate-binding protein [Gemmatimonadales bacterium]|nr:ABC transporter substrate-binding protein [Gemmatimonadales bacterium]